MSDDIERTEQAMAELEEQRHRLFVKMQQSFRETSEGTTLPIGPMSYARGWNAGYMHEDNTSLVTEDVELRAVVRELMKHVPIPSDKLLNTPGLVRRYSIIVTLMDRARAALGES